MFPFQKSLRLSKETAYPTLVSNLVDGSLFQTVGSGGGCDRLAGRTWLQRFELTALGRLFMILHNFYELLASKC